MIILKANLRPSYELPASETADSIVSEINNEMRLVLRQNNIPLEGFKTLMLQRRGLNSDPQETLIILTADDQSNSKGISPWYQGANNIQKMLDKEVQQAQYDGKIWVEIRNEKLMHKSTSGVPRLGSEGYELLERMRDDVVKEVRRSCTEYSNSISFVSRGNLEESYPTILVGVSIRRL